MWALPWVLLALRWLRKLVRSWPPLPHAHTETHVCTACMALRWPRKLVVNTCGM